MDQPKGSMQGDYIYKNTPQRDLMLTFLPPRVKKYKKAPVYFLIPGGGWHTEERQSMIDFSKISVEEMRKQGFAVVSIDYRVCPEGVVMREIVTDCFDAARYVAHYSDVLEIDPKRFCVSGHSAGAHLALMLSYAKPFPSDYAFSDAFCVKAVAAMSAPTVLADNRTNNLRDLREAFRGCDTKEERDRMSPISYVTPNCPPTLLCAGTSDYLVFATSSEMLYKKLQEHHIPSELKLSVGGFHSFEQIHDTVIPSIGMEEMQEAIIHFLLTYGAR